MRLLSPLNNKRVSKIPFCSAVVTAAGKSSRMDGEDKLFAKICGDPVLAYTLAIFQECEYVNEIIIVVREDCIEVVSDICSEYRIDKAAKIVIGCLTRLDSVVNGVYAISEKAELAAIHDGARPCTDQSIVNRTIEAAAKRHAAAPAVPVTSTLKRVSKGMISDTIDRAELYEVQTPQVFTSDLIKAALTNAVVKSIDVTDDCRAAELIGATVYITEGSHSNIKLTTSADLYIAEAIIKSRTQA